MSLNTVNVTNVGNIPTGVCYIMLSKLHFYSERQRQVRKWQQQQKSRQNYNRPNQIKQRESSVTVRPDWIVIEEMEKTQLSKLALPTVSEPEDL